MSIDAIRWAWQQKAGRSLDKLVLLSLADRADERHECYPSIERLAKDTECDRKTVMAAVQRLEESGLIVATKAWGKGTRYRLIGVSDRHDKQYQKRDQSQKRDTSQKRHGTSTKNGTGPVPKTVHEPINNLSLTKKHTRASRFEEFWQAYPRKKGNKGRAETTWNRNKLDDIADTIIEDVRQRTEREWVGKDRQFIPYPGTYLNGKRWNDDIEDNRNENRTRTGNGSRATFDDKIRRLREAADEGEPGMGAAGRDARRSISA